ncbi:metallophosphoesterase [Asticcacaulis sp. DXS10W]|uniref:Metallophosphoesterase n=1 Tax=Asticcacaulis currens TaxID=2984210 RepID=A0ABT5I9C4_9CAUL|nr:metallophosphoesterase [Asticcacaulis currens]MDC7692790.1 metallophosphoesterase [Asticcacaulis currens]
MDLAPFPYEVHFCDPNGEPAIDRLTYAIGDVHGRFDLFKKMVHRIKADMEHTETRCRIILLGDYIDRGRESAKVLNGILALQRQEWCDTVVLKGNHEQVLLKFLKDAEIGPKWFRYGALETIQSFGVHISGEPKTGEEWEALRQKLRAAITPLQRKLLTSLKLSFEAGDYLFVHAGIDPWKDRQLQGEDTLLWIRERFLKVSRACSKAVVHGHTPEEEVVNQKWRIGVDTGAHATGVLSAVRLEGVTRKVLKVNPRDS